jgi:hypothetical protein
VTVVRYWNNDVLANLPGVLGNLLAHAEKLRQAATPSPTLPLSGGGSENAVAPRNDESAT